MKVICVLPPPTELPLVYNLKMCQHFPFHTSISISEPSHWFCSKKIAFENRTAKQKYFRPTN